MRNWFTASILVAAMLGGAVGVGAHEGEGSCPMANLPDCCKTAQSVGNTPKVSVVGQFDLATLTLHSEPSAVAPDAGVNFKYSDESGRIMIIGTSLWDPALPRSVL